jgi:hypothetical protein
MTAGGDCELIRDAFWGQPVNALSSLGLVVAGLVLLRRRPAIGVLACCAGFGSFVFHGPMPAWGEWAHDATLAGLILAVAAEQHTTALLAGLASIGVGFAVLPGLAEPATAVTAGIAVVVVSRGRQAPLRRLLTPALILALAGSIALLSRTGGPLCAPRSIVQGHAVWHLGAALALTMWARATLQPQSRMTVTANSPSV